MFSETGVSCKEKFSKEEEAREKKDKKEPSSGKTDKSKLVTESVDKKTTIKSSSSSSLDEKTITFGKYKDLTLDQLIRDRKYCMWLLQQEWFPKQYEYLYNRIRQHNPKQYFLPTATSTPTTTATTTDNNNTLEKFLTDYEYFNLRPLSDLKISLSSNERKCYRFYLEVIAMLKDKIEYNMNGNPYDIKAPSSWLNNFEKKYTLSRDVFKEFLVAHDLPNITTIVEEIKKRGGVEYNGSRAYLIAKEKSVRQEKFWEDVLKKMYGEDIGVQYKYNKCIFDFLHIRTNTLYECKLGLKDFNEEQHRKYMLTMGSFSLVYLISTDCIVDLSLKTVFTTDPEQYQTYLRSVPHMKEPSKFDSVIQRFRVVRLPSMETYFLERNNQAVKKL